jgi:hypothetical protein
MAWWQSYRKYPNGMSILGSINAPDGRDGSTIFSNDGCLHFYSVRVSNAMTVTAEFTADGEISISWRHQAGERLESESIDVSGDTSIFILMPAETWHGFDASYSQPLTGLDVSHASVPYWFLVAIQCLVPGLMTWRWMRRRAMARAGHCPQCGYDLRATPGHSKGSAELKVTRTNTIYFSVFPWFFSCFRSSQRGWVIFV